MQLITCGRDNCGNKYISEVILAKVKQSRGLNLSRIPDPPYALIVCEKPSVALRIAQALGTSSFAKIAGLGKDFGPVEKRKSGLQPTAFLAISQNGQSFVVCSAIGHLYGLVDVNGNRSVYPVFNVKWMPISRKRSGRGPKATGVSEQIIKSISSLSQNATSFIHACDYDQEGEVIGCNILEYACKNKYERSLRAKFSTLTDQEIRNSFDNLLPPSRRLAEAGRSRHLIDFIYGVNLSRALTEAFKNSNNRKKYHNLSIGRVQGPTLAFVVDRELIIKNHVPVPYWTIYAEFEKDGHIIKAQYCRQRVEALSDATSIVHACSSQDGRVTEIKNQKTTICAPHPFNLGDLQKEAYRIFKFSPSYTLSVAEKLYIAALISYPRTSSQKLPSSINYRKTISDLSKFISFAPGDRVNRSRWSDGPPIAGLYTKLALDLLSNVEGLSPNEGKKTDPAHPAIYPTGEKPRGRLSASEFKLFDLIIRRFLATFGRPAIRQQTIVTILVVDEHFFEAGTETMIVEGWMHFYKPYLSNRAEPGSRSYLQDLHRGDTLKNDGITMIDKFTQPPSRFNQSSLLEEMETKKIGTKATRSEIISTLFKRNYVNYVRSSKVAFYSRQHHGGSGGGIEATDLGVEVVQSMRRYIPNIVSTDLSRSMEELLEGIAFGNGRSDSVIKYAKAKLKEAIIPFKENETEIGNRIADAINITKSKEHKILGTCPVCGNGSLKIIRSGRTKKRFVGCSNYISGKCKATAPLPQNGLIRPTGEICSSCQWPVLETSYPLGAKYRWKFCINTNCSSKKK
jgi:DNA topoisomerase-1